MYIYTHYTRGVRNKGESCTDFERNPGGNPLIHPHKTAGIQESRTLCQIVVDPSIIPVPMQALPLQCM